LIGYWGLDVDHLFDIWEYRECLFNKIHFKPHFIVLKNEKKILGVLPLWYNLDKNYFEFFGGEFCERNKFFSMEKENLNLLLNNLPNETYLEYIDESELMYATLDEMDIRYVLHFNDYNHSLEQYFNSFGRKHRKNLKYDLRQIENKNPKIIFNRIEDFDVLVKLNKHRWEQNSFFGEKFFIDGFKKLINLALDRNELQMISIEVNGKVEAVEVAVLYNSIENIGKLMIIEHMKNSLKHNSKTIDFLSTDSGWKKIWNLTEEKVYCKTNTKLKY